jgi:di/tricarboxylate transporter
MDWQVLFVLGLALATLAMLVTGRVRIDAIGILLMVAPVAAGILTYGDAVAGFGNKAILTIAGLYVVGEGLTRTGSLEFVARTLLRISLGRTRRMILLSGAVAAFISSFLNDTAVVVVFLPIMVEMARTTGASVSHLLMPLSFCALLGGMNTLIGTSTNLIVSGVAEEWGQAPIGMFEMTPVGVFLAAGGILYITLFARKLLPDRKSLTVLMGGGRGHRRYITELVIGPTSSLIGRAYDDVFGKVKAELVFYVREEEMIFGPFPGHTVTKGDVVMLRGGVDEIVDLQRELGLRYAAGTRSTDKEMSFFEVAIAPHSPLVGRSAQELELWRDYGAVTVAVLRAGQHIRERVSKLHLRAGDLLLVLGDEEAEARLAASDDFYVLTGADGAIKLRQRGRRALVIAGSVVALFATSAVWDTPWLPLPFVAMMGALAMIGTGCVTPRRVYHTIDWPVLLFIAGTLSLGAAMGKTGAAAIVADAIVGVAAGRGDAALISGFVLLCILLNMLIAHAAVAVLLTPIAVLTAQTYAAAHGLAPGDPHSLALVRGCVLAIAFGGSICFATPAGHQVNLMVMGPGGYRYADYLRLGLPLSVIAWIVLSIGIPLRVGLF